MYKNLIKQFIENASKNDIAQYINKYGYSVSDNDLDTIFYYLKNCWEDVYEGKPEVFHELKQKLEPDTYSQLYQLYLNVKDKIN